MSPMVASNAGGAYRPQHPPRDSVYGHVRRHGSGSSSLEQDLSMPARSERMATMQPLPPPKPSSAPRRAPPPPPAPPRVAFAVPPSLASGASSMVAAASSESDRAYSAARSEQPRMVRRDSKDTIASAKSNHAGVGAGRASETNVAAKAGPLPMMPTIKTTPPTEMGDNNSRRGSEISAGAPSQLTGSRARAPESNVGTPTEVSNYGAGRLRIANPEGVGSWR